MSKSEERSVWPVVVVLVIVGYAFYWGWIAGFIAFVVGTVALGWKDRHKGPISIRKDD